MKRYYTFKFIKLDSEGNRVDEKSVKVLPPVEFGNDEQRRVQERLYVDHNIDPRVYTMLDVTVSVDAL